MIEVPRLTENDLREIKSKKIILYATEISATSDICYEIFKHHNIEVLGIYLEAKPSKISLVKSRAKGLHCFSAKRLVEFSKRTDILVQCIAIDPSEMDRLKTCAYKQGLKISPIDAGKLKNSFQGLILLGKDWTFLKCILNRIYWEVKLKRTNSNVVRSFFKTKCKDTVVICTPPKTADFTLQYTFDVKNQKRSKVQYFNLWHNPTVLKTKSSKKAFCGAKILVGVRDPISQNLSTIYQKISFTENVNRMIFVAEKSGAVRNRKRFIKQCEEALMEYAGDAQKRWNLYTHIYMNATCFKDGMPVIGFIQWFMKSFQKNILDITLYPFDQEKGYTLIKDNNVEVFVYQLEKLNNLVPELSAWVGVPFDRLEKGNAAEDKWIAESYKQAQKEIKITQEYFDKCFDEPYVNHCYSEADIEKFKARWRPHIKKQVDTNT